ncbi:UBX domain-containing protein 1 [Takifugu rubripes]|nr:UBX domain-containing protein 1 [Takifugu rubripes]|eukprot:XP_011608833.1 PREDICTED: UBX domain-containing protein 1 [Takifugu rubripes]
MSEQTTLESLLEMGFDRNRAEKAVAYTGNQGIEQAMDWLMEHEEDPGIDEPYVPPAENVLGGEDETKPAPEEPSLADTAEGEGSGNDGEESARTPLTEEEKLEQVKRLEDLMRVKQAERREREQKELLEREIQRRKQGQELQKVRQKLQDDEMKKLAELRRKEKMEEKLARQRVKDKIARDREERAQKFGGGGQPSAAATTCPQPGQPSPSSPTSHGPPPSKKEYDESRIQVRLLDGSTITTVFKALEPLAAVRVYVQMNSNVPEGQDFTLLSPYPRHVYTEQDMEKPLKELGLVPSAVLVVAKK